MLDFPLLLGRALDRFTPELTPHYFATAQHSPIQCWRGVPPSRDLLPVMARMTELSFL
jgi:hypothetical protein